jgi:anaerobic magnesium-protoporphyrin IX monomethyl ester cyclase
LLRDEAQLARLGDDPAVNSSLLEELRLNIRASREGLVTTQSEVEA